MDTNTASVIFLIALFIYWLISDIVEGYFNSKK